MKAGHITLHRKIIEWEWYSDVNTCRLFIHLLLTANWQDKMWQGKLIRRGEKITSIQHLAEETNLTNKQIRLCLKKLEKTGEIKAKGANKHTTVTLVKYNDYQTPDDKKGEQKDNQRANKGQTKGKQRATTKPLEELEELEELKALQQEENNHPFDLQSTGDDFYESNDVCLIEPKKDTHEKPIKEKKPNAWGIWVDINREFGRSDPYSAGKDLKAAKSILAEIKDPEKYADILRQFLDDDDKFLMQNGHGISFLPGKINKYLNQSYQPKDTYNVGDDPEQLAYIIALEERIANENKGA